MDAVISQDSDCFLYGARMVLRNFTMSPCYTCDMYTMDNIAEKLSLGRQKLLALSLLCGCDYEAGVQGVGKQSALKFLASLPDNQVLDRLVCVCAKWFCFLCISCNLNNVVVLYSSPLERALKKLSGARMIFYISSRINTHRS